MSTTAPRPLAAPLRAGIRLPRLAARAPLAALALLAAGALAGFLTQPTYPNYDSLYSLLWAREVLDGAIPGFDAYRAPTQHPLLLPVGLALAPLGDAGARLLVLLCIASFVALVAAVWRLGALAAGVLGAAVAAALVASRLNLSLLAAIGFLDIPYCALVCWAIVLEMERPRRGGPVWALLALAGLLRPEAWLLAGAYALWIGRPWWRSAALAAIAPGLWMALDLLVTGDPLFSTRHTDALALELHRERPLLSLPGQGLELLAEILKPPVLALGVVGVAVAVRTRRRDLWLLAVVALLTAASYLVIASGGLAIVWRYLLLTAIPLAVFASLALTGWTRLGAGPVRRGWAAGAAVAVALGTMYVATHTSPAKALADVRERRAIRADLKRLLHAPAVVAARRCGPISVPNHKLIPEVRWLLDLPEGAVVARSDRSRPAPAGGVAILIEREIERRPALNVHEVPDDGLAILAAPPGFAPLAHNRRFAAWGRC